MAPSDHSLVVFPHPPMLGCLNLDLLGAFPRVTYEGYRAVRAENFRWNQAYKEETMYAQICDEIHEKG